MEPLYLLQCKVTQVKLNCQKEIVEFPNASAALKQIGAGGGVGGRGGFTCPFLLLKPLTGSSSGRRWRQMSPISLMILFQSWPVLNTPSQVKSFLLPQCRWRHWFLTSAASLVEFSRGDQTLLLVQMMPLVQGAILGSW